MHGHVQSAEAEAKFWMEPQVELEANYGFPEREIARIRELLERRQDEIRQAWRKHFPGWSCQHLEAGILALPWWSGVVRLVREVPMVCKRAGFEDSPCRVATCGRF